VVLPGQFIPLAEELGIIKPIGAGIFQKACVDAVRYLGDVKVAVNLSPIQLEDDGIIGIIRSALSVSGLDPARLEIEITESALLKNSTMTIALLVRLHDLGLSIALDDFGTGYSSLSYLRSFPFDKIKIDRLFISEMATRDDCAAIVSSVVSLAARLGMTTTAEGVETNEQLNLVRDVGCSSAQGYLFGRPQPIQKAAEMITAQSMIGVQN
jgi:EAL domain-containing protein (putative c-di-GMP-specific phosphodiesterase class I)